MSRSGYSDDCDGWALIRWRGAVTAAIRGARGQEMLRELLAALDAMPAKELVANELEADGKFCALGVLGHKRGVDMTKIDVEDRSAVAKAFGIAEALAAEIMFENDASTNHDAARWRRVRAWVASHVKAGSERHSDAPDK